MFITTIHSIDSLEKLKGQKADAVIIGEHYSIRSSITVKKRIYSFGKRSVKSSLKLYINFLRLCMDEDLSGVREYFSILKNWMWMVFTMRMKVYILRRNNWGLNPN